jgi:hypothetical protein
MDEIGGPEQIDVLSVTGPGAVPSEDPFGGGLNVTVSVPETVEVRMVDASVLADYEMWLLFSSILGSAVVGFVVAAIQSEQQRLWVNALVFGILFLLSLGRAFWTRSRLRRRSRSIPLRTISPGRGQK